MGYLVILILTSLFSSVISLTLSDAAPNTLCGNYLSVGDNVLQTSEIKRFWKNTIFIRGGAVKTDEDSGSGDGSDDDEEIDCLDSTFTDEDDILTSGGVDNSIDENENEEGDLENDGDDGRGDSSDDNSDDEEEVEEPRKRKKYDKKRNPSILETGANSLTSAAAAAFKLTKGGVKLAVDLVSAKHVSAIQIVGKWRMDQEVQIGKGATVTCPATLEFTEDGRVITTFEGKTFTSDYKFTERPWPRKCSIHFEAAAFQGPGDKEPSSMFYKGYFKKSIMNPNVVLIRGRVYKLLGKLFWKQQKKCGTFRATQKRYR